MSTLSFRKFARSEVLEVKRSASPLGTLSKFASHNDDNYISDDGYLYVRVRAISSRVNKNYDGWPSEVLKQSYSSFLHRPIFVEHNNNDPLRARGVIVDTQLHVEDAKTASEIDPYYKTAADNHKPPTWIELLLEIDAQRFPKLARAIIDGTIDGFSMGANVAKTACSVCGNIASDIHEFCSHQQHKGAYYDSYDDEGRRTSKLAYEDCIEGVDFFEISAVFDPADETALTLGLGKAAAREAIIKEGEHAEPMVDQARSPKSVDTLRQEDICPVCGGEVLGGQCSTCRYQVPPEGLNNPDLEKAKKVDQKMNEQRSLMEIKKRKQEQSTNNIPNPEDVTGEGVHAKVAARRVNPKERPLLPPTQAQSDKPKNTKVIKDSLKPVESKIMKKRAGEPHGGADTKPDAVVDVEAVGGAVSLKEPKSESVEKAVETQGHHTDTWGVDEGNTLGQADPVGDRTFPNKESHMEKKSLEVLNDTPKQVNVEAPLKEEVGDHTDTWGAGEGNSAGQAEPVTSEEGVGGGPVGDSASKSSHVIAALRVAELETELGITPPDEKFDRVAQLEVESSDAINARLDALSKAKTATASRQPSTTKVAGRLPSFRGTPASGGSTPNGRGMGDVTDSQIFM